MSGLIFELQSDALNSNVRVADLLRKALVVSKKLGIKEMEQWLLNELNGYSEDEVPVYRKLPGQVKAWNPYNGVWIPIIVGDPKINELLSHMTISHSIGELDSLGDKGGSVQFSIPHGVKVFLIQQMGAQLEPVYHISIPTIFSVLNAVRNAILEWSLELEQKGILGEGMTFSKEEKKAAVSATYQITNNIGSMSNSQLQQHSAGASQTINASVDIAALAELIAALKSASSQLQLDSPSRDELTAEIQTLESQVSSPKPKKTIIQESLKSARTVLEGAAGNILASNLTSKIEDFLKNLPS